MSGLHTNTVTELVDALEAAVVAIEGVVVLDTVEGVEAAPQGMAQRGVFVEVPSTLTTEELRGDTVQLEVDTLRVHLVLELTHIDGQKEQRREGLRLEDEVLYAVLAVERQEGTGWRIERAGVERGPHPRSAGWWRSIQTFKARRYQDVFTEAER